MIVGRGKSRQCSKRKIRRNPKKPSNEAAPRGESEEEKGPSSEGEGSSESGDDGSPSSKGESDEEVLPVEDSCVFKDENDDFSTVLEPSSSDMYAVVLDEIILEGLDGITIETLWKRFSHTTKYLLTDGKIKESIWQFIVSLDKIKFYELPSPRPPFVLFSRYDYLDPDLGMVVEPKHFPQDIYPHHCVSDKSANIVGSCSNYETRKDVSDAVRSLSLLQAEKQFGTKLVMVADQDLRTNLLMQGLADPNVEFTDMQYCILERIGRSRSYGEITQGKFSLQEICKDAKILFYNRKVLKKQRLIEKQLFYLKTSAVHHTTGSLFHLQRFFNQKKLKMQIITERIVDALRNQPHFRMKYDELRRLGSTKSIKKLAKTTEFQRFVKSELLPYRKVYPEATKLEWKLKSNGKERSVRMVQLIEPCINVSAAWHEDNNEDNDSSDDETIGSVLTNKSLLNQAYNIIFNAGAEGLSIKSLERCLSTNYYTTRACVISLTKENLIESYKVDQRRQKIIKYFACCFKQNFDFNENAAAWQKIDRARKAGLLDNVSALNEMFGISEPAPDLSDFSLTDLKDLNRENDIENFDREVSDAADYSDSFVKLELEPDFDCSGFVLKDRPFICVNQATTRDLNVQGDYKPPTVFSDGDLNYNKIDAMDVDSSDFLLVTAKPESSLPVKLLLMRAMNEGVESVREELLKEDLPFEIIKKEAGDSLPENEEVPLANFNDSLGCLLGPNPVLIKHETDVDNIELKLLLSTKPARFVNPCAKFKASSMKMSLRFVKRANIILNIVRKEKIVTDIFRLSKFIWDVEKKENYNVTMDKKSLQRLLLDLVQGGYVKIIKIILKHNKLPRVKDLICEPSVSVEHKEIHFTVEQMKMKFFVVYSKVKSEHMRDALAAKYAPFDSSRVLSSISEIKKMSAANKKIKLVYDKTVGRRYGHSPKFMRMRILHEFLYYLVYERSSVTAVDVESVHEMYRNKKVVLSASELKDYETVYSLEIGWKMFVPPLPAHNGWPEGWILVCDVLLRLPLSMFVKLYNVSYVIPGIDYYLQHPVRKHTLVKDLPVEIRNVLLMQRKYIHCVHETLVRLNCVGLLQFGPHKYKEKDQVFVFINKNAVLYDTTTSAFGYRTVSDGEYEAVAFTFSSAEDVEKYWNKQLFICMNTKLGNPKYNTVAKLRASVFKDVVVSDMEAAVGADVGYIPGDRKGAGGLDSSLWSHMKRNWMWNKPQEKSESRPKAAPKKRKAERAKFKPIKFTERKTEQTKEAHHILKKYLKVPRAGKAAAKEAAKAKAKKKAALMKPKIAAMRKRDYHDLTDRKIMKSISRHRVAWDKREDEILVLCKIVSICISPNSDKQVVPYVIIRDVLHKLNASSSANKTSKACLRRIVCLSKRSYLKGDTSFADKAHFLNSVPDVKTRCSNLRKKIKEGQLTHPSFAGMFCDLIAFLLEEGLEKLIDDVLLRGKERDQLGDGGFDTTLYYCPDDTVDLVYYEDVGNEKDISLDVLKSIVHSFLGSSEKGAIISNQLLHLNQLFPDDLLRTALNVLHKRQFLVKRSCVTERSNLKRHRFQFSFNYVFAQVAKYPAVSFIQAHDLHAKLLKFAETHQGGYYPLSAFLDHAEQGHNIAMSELAVMLGLNFSIDVPEEVLKLNPSIEDHSEVIKELALRYKYIVSRKRRFKTAPLADASAKGLCLDESAINPQVTGEGVAKPSITIDDIIQKVIKAYDSKNEKERMELERAAREDLDVITAAQVEEEFGGQTEGDGDRPQGGEKPPERRAKPEESRYEDIDLYSSESDEEVEEASGPTVNEIMTGMMENSPQEPRKIPYITDLTYLLTQGLIPELDKDIIWLEKLRDHFVMICPTSKVLVEPKILDEANALILPEQKRACEELKNKLKGDLFIKDCGEVEFAAVAAKLEELGACPGDVDFVGNLIKYIHRHKATGVVSKQLKKYESKKNCKLPLKTVMDLLIGLKLVWRFGVTRFRFVHHAYREVWLTNPINYDDNKFTPNAERLIYVMPWTNLDGTLNSRVFVVWISVILSACLTDPNTGFKNLIAKYCFLKPTDMFYILESLQSLGCIRIMARRNKFKDLSTLFEEAGLEEDSATYLDNFDDIYVECQEAAMTLLGSFIKGISV